VSCCPTGSCLGPAVASVGGWCRASGGHEDQCDEHWLGCRALRRVPALICPIFELACGGLRDSELGADPQLEALVLPLF
jgi:hypothetical protein